ncbi:MAG: hypothetical protein LBG90_03980 [Spirochaetaceae bacterium]|jgi:hypothetical protein|nr:hypothetical protein [Spirochaetaceae bacterium]
MEVIEEYLQGREGNSGIQKAAKEYEASIRENLLDTLESSRGQDADKPIDWKQIRASLEKPTESFFSGIAMAIILSLIFGDMRMMPHFTGRTLRNTIEDINVEIIKGGSPDEIAEKIADIKELSQAFGKENVKEIVKKEINQKIKLAEPDTDNDAIDEMQFREVIEDPDKADQKQAIFEKRNDQNAVMLRHRITFTQTETDDQYEINPTEKLDPADAEDLVQNLSKYYNKKTVILTQDGSRYSATPETQQETTLPKAEKIKPTSTETVQKTPQKAGLPQTEKLPKTPDEKNNQT